MTSITAEIWRNFAQQ